MTTREDSPSLLAAVDDLLACINDEHDEHCVHGPWREWSVAVRNLKAARSAPAPQDGREVVRRLRELVDKERVQLITSTWVNGVMPLRDVDKLISRFAAILAGTEAPAEAEAHPSSIQGSINRHNAAMARKAAEESKPAEADELQQLRDEQEECVQAIERWKPLTDSLPVAIHKLVNAVQCGEHKPAEPKATSATVRSDNADKEFLLSYEFNGCKWSSSVWATTWEEADMKLRAMAVGTIDGRIVGREEAGGDL